MATSTLYSSGFSPILYAQVSDGFRLLHAAASKAEEAATRYETHTTGLLQAKNPSLRGDVADISASSANSHPPLKAPPTAPDNPESYQARDQDDNIQDSFKAYDGGIRSLTHQRSCSSVLEGSSNPEDRIEASQDDNLTPSSYAKMPWNGESLSNKRVFQSQTLKNPSPTYSARKGKSQSPDSQGSSDPLGHSTPPMTGRAQARKRLECFSLTSKAMEQRQQHKLPKMVVEWMHEGKPTASELSLARSGSERPEPVGAKWASKARFSRSQTSPLHKTTQGAFGTPGQMSTTRPTPSPISDAVKTTRQPEKESSVQNLGQLTTVKRNPLPLHLADDLALVQVFKDTIYAFIKASEKPYRGRIPEEMLRTIGKSVSG